VILSQASLGIRLLITAVRFPDSFRYHLQLVRILYHFSAFSVYVFFAAYLKPSV